MALDADISAKKAAIDGYTILTNAIKRGNPGLGNYNVFSLPDEWKNLLIDAEKFAYTFTPYVITLGNLSRDSLDYKTKTANYKVYGSIKRNDRYTKIIDVIAAGYKEAWNGNWSGLPKPENWPKYSVSGNYVFNYPEGTEKDSTGKNWYKSKRIDFNSFAVRFTGGNHNIYVDRPSGYQPFLDGFYLGIDAPLFEVDIVIIDDSGKQLTRPQRFSFHNPDGDNFLISGISQNIMDMIDNGEAFPAIIACYLKYGYGAYNSVYADTVDSLGNIVGKWECNSLLCDSVTVKGGKDWVSNDEKCRTFVHNLKDLKVPMENPNAEANVDNALGLDKYKYGK